MGYVGFNLSYGCKYFNGFARDKENERIFGYEACKDCKQQSNLIKEVEFYNVSYDQLEIPKNSIIYCDPPYKNTTKYKTNDFDHGKFWDWCREKHKEGHRVFISEYNPPPMILKLCGRKK